jgi:enamine deaminase RidA (YjgF/YER057c/UK114 family)
MKANMYARLAICIAIGSLLLHLLPTANGAQKKKSKKEEPEITQVLELPKDPPQAVVAQTERLVFHVSPLSAKGLLSQQTRDAVKALWKVTKGSQIVKLRALVAGSGDMRRVPAVVSEMFTEKRQALPAVTVVQVGALPLDGAQVVLESVSVNKKVVNPNGIAFVSGQAATVSDPVGPLQTAMAGLEPRAITCFLNTLDKVGDVRTKVATAYPKTAMNFAQIRRDTLGDFVECEAVAARQSASAQAVERRNIKENRYSDVVLVGPGRILISGTQLAFGSGVEDIRLAFGRLEKAIAPAGGRLADVVRARLYPLTSAAAETAGKVRWEFSDAKQPPATTMLVFEGLPSLDAAFGLEVVARLP